MIALVALFLRFSWLVFPPEHEKTLSQTSFIMEEYCKYSRKMPIIPSLFTKAAKVNFGVTS